jgi:hypothetical protein
MSSRRAGGAGLRGKAPWRSARRPAPFVSSTRCARQRRRLHRCLRCPSKLVQTGQRLGDSHPTRHLLPCLRRATESQHRGPVLAEGERRFEHAPRPRESLDREHRERAGSVLSSSSASNAAPSPPRSSSRVPTATNWPSSRRFMADSPRRTRRSRSRTTWIRPSEHRALERIVPPSRCTDRP